MNVLSRDQVRNIDRLAIERYGIPGVVLMENAGRNASAVILEQLRELSVPPEKSRVAILCGGGNNGGDGYVIARHLHNAGCVVMLYAASDPAKLSGDAAINYAIIKQMNLPLRRITTAAEFNAVFPELDDAHLLVDALLGTGFRGDVRPDLAAIITYCNQLQAKGKRVVAIDVPSGLDCDTGAPSNATIVADVTVTFVAAKRGFLEDSAKEFLGTVIVADIGAPKELIGVVQFKEGSDILNAQAMLKQALPSRISVADAMILMQIMLNYEVLFPNNRSAKGCVPGDYFFSREDWGHVFSPFVDNIDPIELKTSYGVRERFLPTDVEQATKEWKWRLALGGFKINLIK